MPAVDPEFKIGNQPYVYAGKARACVEDAGVVMFGTLERFSELGEAAAACAALVELSRPSRWSASDGVPKGWAVALRSALEAVAAAQAVARETPDVLNRGTGVERLIFARGFLEEADRWLRSRVEVRG